MFEVVSQYPPLPPDACQVTNITHAQFSVLRSDQSSLSLIISLSGHLLGPPLLAAGGRHGVPPGGEPVQLRGRDHLQAEQSAQLPRQGPRAQVRDEPRCPLIGELLKWQPLIG